MQGMIANPLLDGLNPQQQQAVMAGTGPVLVLAGPGSGKTRVLTHRIAYLIGYLGVRPYHVLAVTFTNKAAREMEARVENLLGQSTRGLTLGTFHAVCARILRREAEHLPFDSNYVIFDADDQLSIVKRVLKDLNVNDKLYRPQGVHAAISNAKNELILPDAFPVQTYRDEVIKRVYERYQQALLTSNALDFDDLLLWTAHLLEEQPAVRERYARRYEHILVDEFQDTNMAQYTLLRHLASFHRNIFVVGDADQCFPPETPVQTPEGAQPIADLQAGEQVIAASGRGSVLAARVNRVGKRHFEGELVAVKTQKGLSFRATPNHIVFTRLGLNPGLHYVYLMYRRDKGYRIGVASHARSDGTNTHKQIGLRVRSNQEKADKMWVLRVCEDRADAYYWESFYAFTYGVPTTVFDAAGRSMKFTQEKIDRLYAQIDTRTNARRLMEDLGLDENYPHYRPQGTFRNLVNLRYFGDGRKTKSSPWHAHRVDLWSSEDELAQKLKSQGYHPRIRSRNNWRIGFSRLHYDDIHAAARKLSDDLGGAEIVVGAFLVDKGDSPLSPRFALMPASQLHPSMILAVAQDGEIVEDVITEVHREPYEGDVYDLEVDNLHNYLAGGIVVHNSIYRWRGADYRNVLRFEQDFPDAQVILLEQNYRSTQTILDTAMAVIDRNPNRKRKQLFTERGRGPKVILRETYDDREQAAFVVETIAKQVARQNRQPGDFAVMYRTNAQSRVLEEAFLAAGLPYKLVGAQRFYGRREIKDVIAYLRLVHNPNDQVSLDRVINTPTRGIGSKTQVALRTEARKLNLTPGELLLTLAAGDESPQAERFTRRALLALSRFAKMLSTWIALRAELPPRDLMDKILEDTNYRTYIDDGTDEGRSRWENVVELRRLAAEYRDEGMEAFLEDVALVSDQDTLDADANVPTLLTLHAAKGLEFPVVFIVGLNDGTLPHIRSFDEPESMQEERRLFYVGITRAKDQLYLLHSLNRYTYGYAEPAEPSRFIADIPDDLLDDARPGRQKRKSRRAAAGYESWTLPSPKGGAARKKPKPKMQYSPGMKVEHSVWGEGMVLNAKLDGDDEIVDIFFDSVGLKRVVAAMAKLKIK
jgi:DNA helicase-2/ATP-dependent DNA helicase PcrA